MDEDSSTEQKTWLVYSFGKLNVLGYTWTSPDSVSVREEGEGHSLLMDRKQKRRGNQQWRVWCEESGGWECQKRSGEYGRVCKVEDSHRDKTEQCPWYIDSREWLSSTEFFCWTGSQWENWNRGVMLSVLRFFSMRRAVLFCMRRRLWTEEAGRPERRELQ